MESHSVVFVTASGEEEAARIAHALVESRLAGCVNIIRGVRSIYGWQGKIEDDTEVLMIVKTRGSLFSELSKKVKELHGYAVPEIIGIKVGDGSKDYLDWLDEATGG